ncbi:hypothetical protein SAMN04489759_1197 [Sulfitobacter delicatus]|uniref:Uncharacterized protein n=1 Tax=Sulfitobacter delicatus TaxID=218672 RepID=A0A1G7Z5B5_9RHOB|nr:hypothetical protein SAMN04489759_1197 [Sulfitobacter delicatus]
MVSCAFQMRSYLRFANLIYADRYKALGEKSPSMMHTGGYRMTTVDLQSAYKMTTVGPHRMASNGPQFELLPICWTGSGVV